MRSKYSSVLHKMEQFAHQPNQNREKYLKHLHDKSAQMPCYRHCHCGLESIGRSSLKPRKYSVCFPTPVVLSCVHLFFLSFPVPSSQCQQCINWQWHRGGGVCVCLCSIKGSTISQTGSKPSNFVSSRMWRTPNSGSRLKSKRQKINK